MLFIHEYDIISTVIIQSPNKDVLSLQIDTEYVLFV